MSYTQKEQRQKRIEMRVTTAFLATNGEMVSSISGEPLLICYGEHKPDNCASFHHKLRLNGSRPNGSNAKAYEMLNNYWNISMMSIREHRALHENEGF
jgi:hypothetical protein